jgi:hypothetical protein
MLTASSFLVKEWFAERCMRMLKSLILTAVALLLAAPGLMAQATEGPAMPPVQTTAPAPVAKPVTDATKKKGKKDEYTGPTEVVQLPPAPMLDEEGKQRVDPDGKPMFNAPVSQLRDKKRHPIFDEKGKPVFQTATDLGYDEKGHKIKVKKEKPPKMRPMSVSRGTFTVDGVIGKAALNYDIADLKYVYLYAPGIGIAVVSDDPFPGAKEQAKAFNGTTLTVTVDGHEMQLASDKPLMGKKAKPESAYVLVDRDFVVPSRFPVVGYGEIRRPPYAWPGAKPNAKFAGPVQPPPIPVDLRPTLLLAPCPAGQMRKPAPAVLPGQVAPAQPCIPIAKAGVTPVAVKSATPASAPVAK